MKVSTSERRLSLHKQQQQPLLFPKIKSQSNQLISSRSNCLLPKMDVTKHKRSVMLMKEIKPVYGSDNSDMQSDTSLVMKKIVTPEKNKTGKVQVTVLSLNKNTKNRLKNRLTKETFIGEQAVKKYYERYKHFEKYKEKQQFQHQDNPITHIIQLLELHSFAPRKLDLIKLKGSHAILDLKKLGLGHGMMGNVVSELINYMGNFQYVDLSSNGIDRTLSQSLIDGLSRCKIINLSSNRIGKVACQKFSELFISTRTQIQQLYLQDNNLMDNAGVALISQLADYGNLRVLNLNKNFMGNKFASALKQYLLQDNTLEQLYLGWNQIGDKYAKLIFQALAKHQQLKVLDYSWNVIGVFSVGAVANAFRENQSLIHVDISFCQIQKKNAGIIAKALEENKTIYGMHFQGNSGFIDHKGYLRVTPRQHHTYPLPIVKGLIRKIDSIHPNSIRNTYKQEFMKDACWICDSWQQIYIKIKKTDPQVKQCYIHLNCQQYKSIKMAQESEYYQIYRMCPIQQIHFFFTFFKNPGQKTHFVSDSYTKIDAKKNINFTIGQIKLDNYFQSLNLHKNEYYQDPIDQYYYPNLHCIPRSQEVRVNFQQKQQVNFKQTKKVIVKIKKKILREQSLGMKFRELDQKGGEQFMNDHNDRDFDKDYLIKCLQFDIANSKINRLIKNQEDRQNFKEMMIKYYRDFKDTFYYLANSNPSVYGIFSIPEMSFQKFLQEQKYVTKRVTHAKVMLKMFSCLSVNEDQNSSPQKKPGQNTKLFSRPQFLQFLIRLAIEKWCTTLPKPKKKKQEQKKVQEQNEEEESPTKKQKLNLPLPLIEGLQRTMKSLTKYASRIRASIWRKTSYLTIDIYTVIKGYQTFLMRLFEKYGPNKKKLDKPKKLRGLITLEQCKSIFVDTDIKRTKQAAKDADIPFLDAKRLEYQDGNLPYGLNFQQFCQFLARYSEVLWFPPPSCENHQIWSFQNNRLHLPLFIRFQALIVNIYRKSLQFQNRKMNLLTKHGLFLQQSQILIQKIQNMEISTQTDLWMKMNQSQHQNISLRELIQQLRDKYENATVLKQEQIQELQQRQQIDD